MNRVKGIVTALVLVAIGMAACGGGGLSREEYAEQADEICAEAGENFSEIDQPTSLAELETFIDDARSEMNGLLRRLRELEPPDEITDQVGTMLDNLEESIEQFDELLEAAEDNDVNRITEINTEIQENIDEANQAAQDIGLDQCGNTSPTG